MKSGRVLYCAAVFAAALGPLAWMARAQVQSATPNTKANPNFMGTVTPVPDQYKVATAHYRFEAGARTKWHKHSGGQIMLVEEGITHHQNRGGPVMELRANESYYVQPGVEHWHGATPDSSTVQFNTTRGDLTWLEEVSDSDFASFKANAKAKR